MKDIYILVHLNNHKAIFSWTCKPVERLQAPSSLNVNSIFQCRWQNDEIALRSGKSQYLLLLGPQLSSESDLSTEDCLLISSTEHQKYKQLTSSIKAQSLACPAVQSVVYLWKGSFLHTVFKRIDFWLLLVWKIGFLWINTMQRVLHQSLKQGSWRCWRCN